MIETLVVVFAVVVLASFGALTAWRAGGGSVRREDVLDATTPARAAVIAYVVLYVAGSIALLVGGESAGAGPLLAGGALAAFGVGATVAARRVGGSARAISPSRAEGAHVAPVVVLAGIGLLGLAILVADHGLPLLAANPQSSREGFTGPLFDVFRWLVPPAALVAFAVAVERGRPRDRWIATAALVGVGGLEILLGTRALLFELAIGALLIAFWAGRRPSRPVAVGLVAAALAAFVGVQLVRVGPDGGFSDAADAAAFAARRTVDRVVLIHPRTLEIVVTTIPAEEPYFAGATYVRRIGVLLGQADRPSLGYWLYERLFPGQPGGFAAPGVAGEAWANGGPLLVAAVMAALGAVAIWLGGALSRLPGAAADRAYAALVVIAVARTYATSLNGFLVTLVVVTGWWLIASGRLRALLHRTPGAAP